MKLFVTFSLLGILWLGCSHSSDKRKPNYAANTAKYKLSQVDSLARSHGEGLLLWSVMGREVSIDGTSNEWQYAYCDTATPYTAYLYRVDAHRVTFDGTGVMPPTKTGIINETWLNSDSALAIAERNGGSQFRDQNPHNTIAAFVFGSVVRNRKTYWCVTYRSTDDQSKFLKLTFDANTGTVSLRNE